MIKKIISFMIIFLSSQVSAADFSATVSKNEIGKAESLRVKLILHGAKAIGEPEIGVLSRDFVIHSTSKYSSFSNINGVSTSELGWDLTLLPKTIGKLTIPAIWIESNKGKLKTDEINIRVLDSTVVNNNDDELGVKFITITDKAQVYVKQPFVYTLKLISFNQLSNLSIENISSEQAIIDKLSNSKEYTAIIDGKRALVTELSYYITPKTSGTIKISPAILSGAVLHQSRPQNQFMFSSLPTYKPFVLQSEEFELEVLPAEYADTVWLPLEDLEITEEWQGQQNVAVGEAIVRTITIKALGALSAQLPDLEKSISIANARIYPDQPQLSDKVDSSTNLVHSIREQKFTIIPASGETLEFPEIKIKWWDVQAKTVKYATLPKKTIALLPQLTKSAIKDFSDISAPEAESQNTIPSWVYMIVASLLIIIFALLVTIYMVVRNKSVNKKIKTELKIKNVTDLRDYVVLYSSKNWGVPRDLSLEKIQEYFDKNNYYYDLKLYNQLVTNINDDLYAGKSANLEELIKLWNKFRKTIVKTKVNDKSSTIKLNPT